MVANAIPIVKTGKNPDSIKTRIETFLPKYIVSHMFM